MRCCHKSAYSTSVAAKAVDFCNRIYHEEGVLTAEERYEQRLVKVKPLLETFFAWLDILQISGKSKLADAVSYALNERQYLCTFLQDEIFRLITTVPKMQSEHLPSDVRTGCLVIQPKVPGAVRFCIRLFQQHIQTV